MVENEENDVRSFGPCDESKMSAKSNRIASNSATTTLVWSRAPWTRASEIYAKPTLCLSLCSSSSLSLSLSLSLSHTETKVTDSLTLSFFSLNSYTLLFPSFQILHYFISFYFFLAYQSHSKSYGGGCCVVLPSTPQLSSFIGKRSTVICSDVNSSLSHSNYFLLLNQFYTQLPFP